MTSQNDDEIKAKMRLGSEIATVTRNKQWADGVSDNRPLSGTPEMPKTPIEPVTPDIVEQDDEMGGHADKLVRPNRATKISKGKGC